MANGIIVDTGKMDMLGFLLDGDPVINMGLYKNAVTWAHGTLITDITECDFTGYSQMVTGGWSTPALDASFDAYSTGSVVQWTNTGATSQSVVGWFYWDVTNAVLIGGGAFDATLTMTVGMTLALTPELQTQSQF